MGSISCTQNIDAEWRTWSGLFLCLRVLSDLGELHRFKASQCTTQFAVAATNHSALGSDDTRPDEHAISCAKTAEPIDKSSGMHCRLLEAQETFIRRRFSCWSSHATSEGPVNGLVSEGHSRVSAELAGAVDLPGSRVHLEKAISDRRGATMGAPSASPPLESSDVSA